MKFQIIIAALAFATSTFSIAAEPDPVAAKLAEAMKADIRSEKEVARDRNRRPVETLAFFGLKDNMKVIELMPGRGWYTKLLAPALADKGKLTVALGTSRLGEQLQQPGFGDVKVASEKSTFARSTAEPLLYSLSDVDLGKRNADMVLTFRNYHNLDTDSRTALNDAVFKALKPGGIYGVVDHTRRHMQELTRENRRRFDPVQAILEIQAAGFELVDYSPLHYKLDDELRYEVGRKTVTGNTDRWTLKFRKP
ncbi:methyltransferase [Porticoccus sp. W117]|uniref:class I SAM-dependent methyltransferase n=1 Tax=Porticoccus sp. W117 TaxID=3054777 RepID=UPI0025980CEC|nr:methyltransferase [Porticoccus sp. W117]MDM3870328.1 methyltransferase [Porticoccus sp. W117]